MARIVWALFWLVLVVWGVILVDVRSVGDKKERVVALGGEAEGTVASSAGGGDGGVEVGEGISDTSTPHIVEVGESSRPGGAHGDTPVAEEGHASGGGDTEDTFRGLAEMRSGGWAARHHESTILEAFASSSQMGQSDQGVDEAMEEEGHDFDENFVVGEELAEEEEEEADADEGESAMQGRRPAKRHRHLQGVWAFGWDILVGSGPLEGYRHYPSAMLCFRTIAAR